MVARGRRARLSRMEQARRQTQYQLDLIERQITRRMTTLIPQLGRKQSGYRRGKPPDPKTFLERYRANLAAITAERQPEIDALSRKLARQECGNRGIAGAAFDPEGALCVNHHPGVLIAARAFEPRR
jgi:hypothetical protein